MRITRSKLREHSKAIYLASAALGMSELETLIQPYVTFDFTIDIWDMLDAIGAARVKSLVGPGYANRESH